MSRTAGIVLPLSMAGALVLAMPAIVLADPAAPSAPQPTLDQRVARLERMLESQALMELLSRVEQLRQEVQQLRGEIEVSSNNVESVRQRQRDLYMDLDRRLNQLEKSAAAPGASRSQAAPVAAAPVAAVDGAAMTAPAPVTAGAAQDQNIAAKKAAYQQALDLIIKEKRYDEAITALQAFLNTYPAGEYADNAHYWLGEVYYATRRLREAVTEFSKVATQFPDSSKVPDSLLKLGYTYYDLGDWGQARQTLEGLRNRYPQTATAQLADKFLQKMRTEGH